MMAAAAGHDNIIQTLLDFGAILDSTNPAGSTARMLALEGSHITVVNAIDNCLLARSAIPIRERLRSEPGLQTGDIAVGPTSVSKQLIDNHPSVPIRTSTDKNEPSNTLVVPQLFPSLPTVREFLEDLQLQKYIDLFNGIDFLQLKLMDEIEMKNRGLTVFGPRRKIKNAVRQWWEQHKQ